MHETISSRALPDSETLSNLLYRDDEVIVTSGRVEMQGVSCASKYISSISMHEDKPSRMQGWMGMGACGIASLALLLYLYLGKISVEVYIVAYLIVVVLAALVTIHLLLVNAYYKVQFDLINGQTFEISRNSEFQIREIHGAIKEALARSRQDPKQHDRLVAIEPPAVREIAQGIK